MAPTKLLTSKLSTCGWGIWIGFTVLLCVPLWSFCEARSSAGQTLSRLSGRFNPVDATDSSIDVDLVRRDDFSCSADKPCKNGACCGKSGFCGYDPVYCGDGCVSNCEAAAECGQFATTPGKQCPLNTCCSEFGFVSTRT